MIEGYNKTICILHYVDGERYNSKTILNYYKVKLRLDNTLGLKIIPVDRDRNDIETGEIWFKSLIEE